MKRYTGRVLKNMATPPATRKYPFKVRDPFEDYRGELVNNIDECIFCGMCARKCPSQCITVTKKEGLWTCDPYACVYCGICVETCPTDCLSHEKAYRQPEVQKQELCLKGEPPKKKN